MRELPVTSKGYQTLVLTITVILFSAQNHISAEYQVKAVFLYNFTQFVEWPQEAFPDKSSPLIIGVLGKNPFGNFLDETIRGELAKSHPLRVEYYSHISDVQNCHMLFVNNTGLNSEVLEKLRKAHILTVGDVEGFIEKGGIIRFFIKDSRIQMQINAKEGKESGLKISSKLLRVSDIVSIKK